MVGNERSLAFVEIFAKKEDVNFYLSRKVIEVGYDSLYRA